MRKTIAFLALFMVITGTTKLLAYQHIYVFPISQGAFYLEDDDLYELNFVFKEYHDLGRSLILYNDFGKKENDLILREGRLEMQGVNTFMISNKYTYRATSYDLIGPLVTEGVIHGTVIDGKKNGSWEVIAYHLNSDNRVDYRLIKQEDYKDDLLHGAYRIFNYNGILLYQTIFVEGTGLYKEYYNDLGWEGIKIIGMLEGGKREGAWSYYSRSGFLYKRETYKNGKLDGAFLIRDESLAIAHNKAKQTPLSQSELNYTAAKGSNEVIYRTEFKDGNGTFKSFDLSNGHLLEEGRIEDGGKVGKWKYYIYNSSDISKSDGYTLTDFDKRTDEIIVYSANINGRDYHIYAEVKEEAEGK